MFGQILLIKLHLQGIDMDIDSTKTTVVDKTYHWKRSTKDTPRGQKLQLINKQAGVAMYSILKEGDTFFTHYAKLPTFEEDE